MIFQKTSWCKGLTKETDERVRKRSKNIEKKIENKNYKELTKEKSYILGTLCGDAYLGYNLVKLEVIDLDFAEYFSYCLERVYGMKTTRWEKSLKKRKKRYYCSLYSKRVAEDLKKYSFFRTKSWRIPKEIMNNKNEKIIGNFLMGFFDSEGNVGRRSVLGYSSNLIGLKQIQELLLNLNIKSTFKKLNRNYEIYQILICCKPNISIFLNKVSFSIKRKRDKVLEDLNNSPRYSKYSTEQYNKVINLKKEGFGKVKISRITGINISSVSDWIYRKKGVMPFCVRYGNIQLHEPDCFIFKKRGGKDAINRTNNS